MKSLIWSGRRLSRILYRFLEFASRFCSPPLSASWPCSSRDHCCVLCPVHVYSHRDSGAVVAKSSLPPFFSTATELQSFGARKCARPALRVALSALGQPAQFHRVGLSGLHRRTDRLVRGTHASQVLRVERAEGGPDRRTDPTVPSSKFGPSRAIQRSPRKNSCGRRTADGLPGRSTQ